MSSRTSYCSEHKSCLIPPNSGEEMRSPAIATRTPAQLLPAVRARWHDTALPLPPLYKGVAMLGDESFEGEGRLAAYLCDHIVCAREHAVCVVDGNLPQMLHKEVTAGFTRDPIGLGIERP